MNRRGEREERNEKGGGLPFPTPPKPIGKKHPAQKRGMEAVATSGKKKGDLSRYHQFLWERGKEVGKKREKGKIPLFSILSLSSFSSERERRRALVLRWLYCPSFRGRKEGGKGAEKKGGKGKKGERFSILAPFADGGERGGRFERDEIEWSY